MLGRVVAHRVEQRVRHVGLEAERFRPADHLQKLHHVLPAVHAAPADFALGGEALAMLLGDVAGFAEGLGDRLLVLGRDSSAQSWTPVAESMRTTPVCRMPMSRSWRAMRQAFSTIVRNCLRSSADPMAEPPPTGGQTGATTEPTASPKPAILSAKPLGCRPCSNRSMCADRQETDRRPRIWRRWRAPPPSALSIVSRSIGGSESGPLPTNPGHIALCSFGIIVSVHARPSRGLIFGVTQATRSAAPRSISSCVQRTDMSVPRGLASVQGVAPALRARPRERSSSSRDPTVRIEEKRDRS